MASKKRRKKTAKKVAKLVICGVILVALAVGVFFVIDVLNDARGNGGKGEVSSFVIEKGDGAAKVCQTLAQAGAVKYPGVFRLYLKMSGASSKLQVGEFEIEKGSGYDAIISLITTTQVRHETVRVRFTEGWTVEQFVDALVKAGVGSEDRYRQVLNGWDFGYDYIPEAGTENRMEGFLYPDTYEFYVDAKEEDVIRKLVNAFDSKMRSAGVFDAVKEKGLDFYDTLILASIVEKEGQLAEEQPIIASVFMNRLKINMKLQSCATVNYVLEEKHFILTYEDMATESPYNTYLYSGLTPTPISNPTATTMLAAINPADTDYLYFLSKNDGTGSSAFARTLAEHNKNIQKYLK